ncbi:MAG: type II toxin-antitoxin system Phd/YefM family antitoxin [Patescibacteria group bacterium]
MIKQLIADEKFANIQKAQAGLTNLFTEAEKDGNFYTVLRNDQPLGVLIPKGMWGSLVEDLEALSSPNFRRKIARSRSSKKRIKADSIRKMGGTKVNV